MQKIQLLLIIALIWAPLAGCGQDIRTSREEQRKMMVKRQIKARGIKDQAVLEAMKTVPRHDFVPATQRLYAYQDYPLAIGYEQTISQPYIVALMSEALQIEAGDKVLEVGTGSGYQAAILAKMGAEVYSVEIVAPLAQRATALLDSLQYAVHVRTGDGYQGWPEHAPFQGIIVTCSPSDVPPALKNQLAEGGRMVIPVGPDTRQSLVVLTKRNGQFEQESIAPVRFVPMQNKEGVRY